MSTTSFPSASYQIYVIFFHRYVAKKFKDESKILKEYYSEQDKFMELIKQEPGGDVNRTGSEGNQCCYWGQL